MSNEPKTSPPAQPIDPPTLSMRFAVNDSPMAGREGTKVTSRMIRDRLLCEAEGNVALRVVEIAEQGPGIAVGRLELFEDVLKVGWQRGAHRDIVAPAAAGDR